MREIKFRTYDVISESFIYYTLQDIINWIKNMQNWVNWDQNQYTWLNDKNGKEIYEGDIFKCNYWNNYLVIYENDRFQWEDYDNWDFYRWDDHNWEEFEIIWNIYENPELLKK